MPTLTIAHAQYWTRPGTAPAALANVRGGYPVWQASVIATSVLLLILVGF